MKYLKIIVVILATLMLGCLIKPPANVKFDVDKTTIPPGGIFHVIATINNTGKVGITNVKLNVEGGEFLIIQNPKIENPIKVGESEKLIWTIKGPKTPGTYQFKAYLDIVDELKRVWRGITFEVQIKVTPGIREVSGVSASIKAPSEIQGGRNFNITIELLNNYSVPIRINSVDLTSGALSIVKKYIPDRIDGKSKGDIIVTLRAPPAYRVQRIYVIVEYSGPGISGRVIKEREITIVWKPWDFSLDSIERIYGNLTEWIEYNKIVDGYWEWVFNSDSEIKNRTLFRRDVAQIISISNSDLEAAKGVYNYIITNYVLEKRKTGTLDPQEIRKRSSVTPIEADILMVAYLRSLNIPARIVSIYSPPDCTHYPFVEAYLSGKWYVIDFSHMFFGTREEFIASRWYPRIYQQVTVFKSSLVALKPSLSGHDHEDISQEYINITEASLLDALSKKLDAETFLKVKTLIDGIDSKEEKIFAMFLFSSGDPREVRMLIDKAKMSSLRNTIDAFYEFYRDVPWEDDFRIYWEKLLSLYKG
ncbi:transglutaminase domain-containing protein [Pyrococcus abyssi]|uniref:Transglutaminase-like domain-containing protein n=1 Tax=Pyrococcus abyssi (strain GE5 / Orsay) TaxID=272844 RepID=Q9UYD2_PYRAB|nr:transglutaminase domain-containing protein [Pyrococcus abyssi]CAB50480.1 Hypothetical protein PAB1039 [Pyrococcus abyssi GE5]CCE71033.1 TPA: hypothetical protein PAB1039 [Pyrococcus abyssi GE5]